MKDRTTKICITSLMSSMVLISTFIRIPVPIGGMNTMIHLGNAFCVLSGLLLGPFRGGLASGIGSFVFDILSPGYIASAPFTFVFKFPIDVYTYLYYTKHIDNHMATKPDFAHKREARLLLFSRHVYIHLLIYLLNISQAKKVKGADFNEM